MGRKHADKLIGASSAVDNLVPIGTIPANEAQARPLTRLGTAQLQQQAWQTVLETVAIATNRARGWGKG